MMADNNRNQENKREEREIKAKEMSENIRKLLEEKDRD